MAKLIENTFNNITEYPNTFKRQTSTPLDAYSVFKSKELAEDYAANNPIAYVGQIITVEEENTVTAYIIIDKTGTLHKLDSDSQIFATCDTSVNESIKVINVNNSALNLLKDGTRLTVRFINGLTALNQTDIYFSINNVEYMISYNGIDGFAAISGREYIVWQNGILSFIYTENNDSPYFVLDGGTDDSYIINNFVYELHNNDYNSPSEFVSTVKNMSAHVKTNKLTTTSLESTEDTVIESLKVRDDRIDIFKTTENYGTDNQVAESNIVIKKNNSIKIDNMNLELTDTTILDAHKVIVDDGNDSGLQVGSTLKVQDGMIKLGYDASDDTYYSYIECGQKDGNDVLDQTLIISSANQSHGIRLSGSGSDVSIWGDRVKLGYDGNALSSDNAAIDTNAADVSNGVKLRAKVDNSNGGRNNLVVEQNEIRICGDINLKDITTNCTQLPDDVTDEEKEYIEGSLQSTLINLKRSINNKIINLNDYGYEMYVEGDTLLYFLLHNDKNITNGMYLYTPNYDTNIIFEIDALNSSGTSYEPIYISSNPLRFQKGIPCLLKLSNKTDTTIGTISYFADTDELKETYIPFSGGSLDRGASLTLNSASDNRKTEYTWGGFKFYAPSGNAAWAATAGSYWDNAGTTNYGGVGAYGGPSGLQYYYFGAYNDAKLKVQLNGNTSCTGTFTPSKGMDASYLTWGSTASKNITGNTTIVDAPLIEGMSANRFAFKDPSTIIIEYSNDGGATWIDYGAADSLKQKLLTQSNAFYIGKLKPTTSASGRFATADDMLRVTIQKGGLYTNLKKLAIYVTTYGSSGCYVTIDQLLNEATEYTTLVNKQSISGWSGWNIINTIGNKTFGYTSTTGISELRFTFGITTPPSSGSNSGALAINSIQGFGSIQYASDANAGSLPKTGLIYSYDMDKNVTFPTTVTATDFLGNLTGIASAARMDEEGNNIIDTYATKDSLSLYVPIGEWDTQDENADTYFSGYLDMKELAADLTNIWYGNLGSNNFYAGLTELADNVVPMYGWELSDTSAWNYFGGYDDMKLLASDCAWLFMGTHGSNNQWIGIGEVIQSVEDLENQIGSFTFDTTDYVSISEISNEFTNIKENYVTKEEMESYIEETILGGSW